MNFLIILGFYCYLILHRLCFIQKNRKVQHNQQILRKIYIIGLKLGQFWLVWVKNNFIENLPFTSLLKFPSLSFLQKNK